jgi:putative ABC transport system permease protein
MPILQDVRLALRLSWRTPFVTAIILVSMAFSTAATAVIFTAVKSVLIDPLPYARPGELVQLRTEFANFDPSQTHADFVLGSDFKEIARRTRTLRSLGAYGNALSNLAGDASTPPEALYGLRVSASLFPTLGVTPMLGRNILPEEDQPGHAEVMILSFGLWQRRFNSDPSVVGRNITIDGHDCLVIGVMPPEFNFPLRRATAHTPSPYVEFWSALDAPGRASSGGAGALGLVGRLRPGVSVAEAEQDLESIGTALSQEFPATNRDRTLRLGLLLDRQIGTARSAIWLLMAASVMFSLIGCANVANLLLARGMVRQREIAIRIAIGAGRGRIVRQLLTESCVLAVFGGMGGYLLTAAAWKIVLVLAPTGIPRLAAGRAGWAILGFALVAALINGILFGMAPALRAAGTRATTANDFAAAKATAQRKLRTSLVVAEVAISVVLVIVGAQLMGTFASLVGTDPGFQADHILASVVIPAGSQYRTPEARALLYRKFLDSVRGLPGVENVGAVDALPFSGENHGGWVTATENEVMEPRNQLQAEIDIVSSGYLETMGVRLLEGRWFGEDDMKDTSDTVLVNDLAASRLWPGTDPIGKRMCLFCTPDKPNNWKRIVGVVSSVRHASLDNAGPPLANVYVASGALEKAVFLVARTNRPPRDLETAIRRAIARVDPNQPVFLSVSLRRLIADSIADRRFIMSLLVVAGFLALVMSMAGVYGVSSYVASQRTREIGVRIALGATPNRVLGLIFCHGFLSAAMGLGIGLGCAVLVLRVVRGMLTGLESSTPGYVAIGVILVTLTAAFACLLPAQRAAKIEPMSALRQD